jgi:MoaA/NifB/PqqE/SkfB family radical SAM enzyme
MSLKEMTFSLTSPGSKITRYLLHHPEVLVQNKKQGFSYPISAEIDLTWRCSLNCKGCHSKWMHSGVELNEYQLDRILDQLKMHGCKSVTWSGGGDPMESPIFWYALASANACKMNQGLYTYFPNPTQEKVSTLDTYLDFVYSHNFNTKGLKPILKNNTWTCGYLLDMDNWFKAEDYIAKTDLSFFDFVDFRPLCPINIENPPSLDYSWVQEALDLLACLAVSNKQVKYADYKFKDLLRPNFGRNYESCLSTDFVAVIGPNGDMYECVNRRGFPDSILGNLLEEDLEIIWKRKSHKRDSFEGCRILCRNHEMNKELYQLLGPAPLHESFV